MCGIVGYVGSGNATNFLIDGLRRLEYRGYDSAGIAVYENGKINIEKKQGRLVNLENELKKHPLQGHIGIGHTRWATHGKPSDRNAHPHGDCHNHFVVVHNGIIENYLTLKKDLMEKGHVFKSETDTEVVAHLLEELDDGNFLSTVRKMLSIIEGSYSLVIMDSSYPDTIICTKKNNPLIIGLGKGENFIASDIPAVINHTRDIYILDDEEVAVVKADQVSILDRDGKPVQKEIQKVTWSAEAAEKGGYPHFMLKEIFEQPKAVRDTVQIHLNKDGSVTFPDLGWTKECFENIDNILITACGTAYHAGLVAKHYIERFVKIPVSVEIASEYRYSKPLTTNRTLCIVVSQSGETIDTLEALKEAKKHGAKSLAVTNSIGSSIAREADNVFYTLAGPEIAVATTKAYSTQLIAGYCLAVQFALVRGCISQGRYQDLISQLQCLPEQIQKILDDKERIQWFAAKQANARDAFFIGRGLDYAISLEGSLKMKEISYIHSEAYAAGELKHGTISLIEDGTLVIGVLTQSELYEKTISNMVECKSRGAYLMGLTTYGNYNIEDTADFVTYIPKTDPHFATSLAVIPLQLMGYYVSVAKGLDVDKPRNLAKSVTVE